MERRTTIGVAAGVTMTVAAALGALGLIAGLLGGADATTGPGTFEPVSDRSAPDATVPATAAVPSTLVVVVPASDPAAPAPAPVPDPVPVPAPVATAPAPVLASEVPQVATDDGDDDGYDDEHGREDHEDDEHESGWDDDD